MKTRTPRETKHKETATPPAAPPAGARRRSLRLDVALGGAPTPVQLDIADPGALVGKNLEQILEENIRSLTNLEQRAQLQRIQDAIQDLRAEEGMPPDIAVSIGSDGYLATGSDSGELGDALAGAASCAQGSDQTPSVVTPTDLLIARASVTRPSQGGSRRFA